MSADMSVTVIGWRAETVHILYTMDPIIWLLDSLDVKIYKFHNYKSHNYKSLLQAGKKLTHFPGILSLVKYKLYCNEELL